MGPAACLIICSAKRPPTGVVKKFGERVTTQVSPSSSYRGSKLRGYLQIALMLLLNGTHSVHEKHDRSVNVEFMFARIQSSIPESFLFTKLKKKMPSGATGVKPDTGLRAKWSSASALGR
ncbi:hypothetical protein AVEN_139463-1 [Araneus ventricosus]|uniref:Uncharacterized protein n=1 Tax=Araneus ventricosus TaxID=182803 RepID=A0A4Y2SB73_ARAVE|nr:hypothetical protein AVEN_139463-1 [Araneus ventricosus]